MLEIYMREVDPEDISVSSGGNDLQMFTLAVQGVDTPVASLSGLLSPLKTSKKTTSLPECSPPPGGLKYKDLH